MKKLLLWAVVLCIAIRISAGEAWSSVNPERYSGTSFSKAIWHETFAGNETPFTVEFFDGAEGKVEIISTGGRSENKALRTIRSNDKGYMVIRFKKRIQVKKGDKIQLNTFYQGKKNSAL